MLREARSLERGRGDAHDDGQSQRGGRRDGRHKERDRQAPARPRHGRPTLDEHDDQRPRERRDRDEEQDREQRRLEHGESIPSSCTIAAPPKAAPKSVKSGRRRRPAIAGRITAYSTPKNPPIIVIANTNGTV